MDDEETTKLPGMLPVLPLLLMLSMLPFYPCLCSSWLFVINVYYFYSKE